MRYWIMQLFLADRRAGTIFAGLPLELTRQQYLQQAFTTEIRFEHYNRTYIYKPFESPDADYLVGVIAKERHVVVAGPPEEQFAHKEVPDWETANVVINSGADAEADGQKVAMQATVGSPLAIFRSLVEHINGSGQSTEWFVAVNPVTSTESFWTVADQYAGHLKEIDLEFAVPNIWGGSGETEKALKELKEENNAQEVEVKIKNKDGQLKANSERVRQSVDYIAQGGGTARLKDDTDAIVYSSETEENVVSVPVEPDIEVQEADVPALEYLLRRLFRREARG